MTKNTLNSLIGKQVVLKPTGNNVRRSKPIEDQLMTTTLLKVRGLRATVENMEKTFDVNGGLDKNNSGYKLYASMEHAINSFTHGTLLSNLRYIDLGDIDLEDIETLKSISQKYKEI